MTTLKVNGVTLGVEHFGDAAAPLTLLAGGPTMLSWPDPLCEALARGGRHVVRYDLRDSGTSTTVDPEAPAYTLRDLAADAAALARELDDRLAHLAGISVGGMVAQIAALDYPDAFSALTLVGTRPVAPGRVDDDLPEHDAATMERLFSRPMPDWSDRAAVAEFATAGAEILGNNPVAARATAARIWNRTPGTAPPIQMANQLGLVFAKLNCEPRWRERPTRDRDPHARRPRRPGPVLPRCQRRGNRARDPWGTAADPRGSCHCDPRRGGRRSRQSNGHARVRRRLVPRHKKLLLAALVGSLAIPFDVVPDVIAVAAGGRTKVARP
jgi:pimeloyl-ACP methyl ester carboxylesterase